MRFGKSKEEKEAEAQARGAAEQERIEAMCTGCRFEADVGCDVRRKEYGSMCLRRILGARFDRRLRDLPSYRKLVLGRDSSAETWTAVIEHRPTK